MSLSKPGNDFSTVEVTAISRDGIRLRAHDREWFLSYTDFPWFREQPEASVMNVEEPAPGHFHWPDMDVDLSEEIIEHPERYPNVSGL